MVDGVEYINMYIAISIRVSCSNKRCQVCRPNIDMPSAAFPTVCEWEGAANKITKNVLASVDQPSD